MFRNPTKINSVEFDKSDRNRITQSSQIFALSTFIVPSDKLNIT